MGLPLNFCELPNLVGYYGLTLLTILDTICQKVTHEFGHKQMTFLLIEYTTSNYNNHQISLESNLRMIIGI